jgi:hypothetical protein
MMANFLDVDVFNRGIEHYLRRHKFGNAKQVLYMTYAETDLKSTHFTILRNM